MKKKKLLVFSRHVYFPSFFLLLFSFFFNFYLEKYLHKFLQFCFETFVFLVLSLSFLFFFFSPRFYTFARVSFPSASTLVLDEVEKTVQEAREKDWLASYRIPVILILQGVLIHLIDSFLTRTWTKTNRTLKRERENLSNHLVFQIIIKCINYHAKFSPF